MIGQILQALMYPFLFLSMYFEVLLLLSFFENAKKIKDEETQDITESISIGTVGNIVLLVKDELLAGLL